MSKDLDKIAIIVAEKAYGAFGKQMLNSLKNKKKQKKEEQQETMEKAPEQVVEQVIENEPPVQTAEQTVANAPDAQLAEEKIVEQPVMEQVAPEVEQPVAEEVKEDKPRLVTPSSKAKEEYSGLFGMFTEMMGGENEDKSGEEMLSEMFALAFGAMMGVDVFKERLEERERQLQEMLEQERQARLAAEQKLEMELGAKEPAEQAVGVETAGLNAKPKEFEYDEIKIMKPEEATYQQLLAGKENGTEGLTMKDLKEFGVTAKDVEISAAALTKDNPDKMLKLAPKGMSDEKAPISKELAVAAIGRKQERDAIMRSNMNVRA